MNADWRRRWAAALAGLLVGLLAGGCSPLSDEGPSLAEPELGELAPALRGRIDAARERVGILEGSAGAASSEVGAAYGDLGRLYHAHDLFPAAVGAYQRAADLDPSQPRWPYYLGQVELAKGAPEAALPLLERAAQLDEKSAAARLALGRALHEAGRGREAEKALHAAVAIEPRSAEAFFRFGQIALERGELEAALKRFHRALEIQGDAEPPRRSLAATYRALGQEEEAREVLAIEGDRPIVSDDPWMAEVRALAQSDAADRAARLFESGRFEEASSLLREAVAARPDDAVLRLNLGAALVRAGHAQEARQALEKAVELDPGQPRAHFNLATLLASMQEDGAAIASFRTALKLDPAFLAAHFNLANAELRQGGFAAAAEHFGAVVAQSPADRDARYGEAVALTQAGEARRAESRLREGLAALPNDPRLTQALARLLAAGPDPEVRDGAEARTLAESLIRTQSEVAHVETLAMAYAELGDFASAVDWQKRAVDSMRSAGRGDLLGRLEANLHLYENGQPCREPWHPSSFGASWGS